MQILRTFLAIIIGLFIGSTVNMSLVELGGIVFPLPNNLDSKSVDDLMSVMPSLDWYYFIFPFLAHALGTLSGVIIAVLVSQNHKKIASISVALFFFAGGITINLFMLPSPLWFSIVDLLFAYIPMALLVNRKVS